MKVLKSKLKELFKKEIDIANRIIPKDIIDIGIKNVHIATLKDIKKKALAQL